MDAFVTGGPESGKKVSAQIILAGTDRMAIDAVGVALLRYYGTTPEVNKRGIFEQEQIARAVELGIGINGPDQIELLRTILIVLITRRGYEPFSTLRCHKA